MKFSRSLIGAAAVAATLASGSASALTTFTLDVPGGINYGSVTLTDLGDSVEVHALLSPGYNFVDTGTHELFGFNAVGVTVVTVPGSGYTVTGGFTQPNFGNFSQGLACGNPPCNGAKNSSVPNNEIIFTVSSPGISESSFTGNTSGYYFSADIYGPVGVAGVTPATFAVGATVPVPEPETYAMMLAGLAAVGFVARRRKSA